MMNEIFEDQADVIENIRDSAKTIGMNVLDNEERKEAAEGETLLVAKRNCKVCWGKGWVTCSFPGNDGSGESKNFYCTCVKQVNK